MYRELLKTRDPKSAILETNVYICPRSSYPIHVATYYIKWVTNSWTDGINSIASNTCLTTIVIWLKLL